MIILQVRAASLRHLRARSVRLRAGRRRADPVLAGRHPLRHGRRAPDHLQGRPQLVAGQEGRRRRLRWAHPLARVAG